MHRLLVVLFLAASTRGSNFNQQEQIQQYSNDHGMSAFDTLGSSLYGASALGHASPYGGFGNGLGLVPGVGQPSTLDNRRAYFVPSSPTFGHSFGSYAGASPMMIPQTYETPLYEPIIGQPMMGSPLMGSSFLSSSIHNTPMIGSSMVGTPMMNAPLMGTPVMNAPLMSTPMMNAPLMGGPMVGAPMMGGSMTYAPPLVAEQVYQPMMSSAYMEPALVSAPYVESTFIGSPLQRTSIVAPLAPPMMRTPIVGTAVYTQPVLLGDEEEHHDS